MLFNLKKYQKLIFIIKFFFIFQLSLILSQTSDDTIDNNSKAISLNQEIIYIININTNNKIYKFGNNEIGEYSSNIRNKKNIIKIDEKTFTIFGTNNYNNLCFQTFILTSDSVVTLYSGIKTTSINLQNLLLHDIKCYSNVTCILSMSGITNNFYIYQINLQSTENLSIKEVETINSFSYYINSSQCDSFEINKYFCIFSWRKSQTEYNIYYYYGEFNNIILPQDDLNEVCSGNCFLGSLTKVNDDSNNKFLICYQTKSGKTLSILCQYHYIEGTSSIEDDIDVIYEISKENIIEKPLILRSYKFTFFIEIDIYSDKEGEITGFLIMFSSDFKIIIPSNTISGKIRTDDFFNDKYYYYTIYEDKDTDPSQYKIFKKTFKLCNENEYVYFSKNDYEEFDFITGHTIEENGENDLIIFSLDKDTKLYKGEAIIDFTINPFEIEKNKIFKFKKVKETTILKNDYCYVSRSESGLYSLFSLICRINLKTCYETCKTCNSDKIGYINDQYCSSCNENYFPIKSEIENKDGFNCYPQNYQTYSNTYFYNNAYYYCDDSCSSCDNSTNCITCKDGYYFMVNKNNEILYQNKCLSSIPLSYYFEYNANLRNKNGNIIKSVYKPCYDTCYSCRGSGNQLDNSCNECRDNYIKYNFNEYQCLINTKICTNNKIYWQYKENNISCIDKCDYSLITTGENKGQCVQDCQNYINPYSNGNSKETLFLTLSCEKQSYCISYSTCIDINFVISKDGQFCVGTCTNFSIYDFNDPSEYFDNLPVANNSKNISTDEKLNNINQRIKITKILKESKSFINVINTFDTSLISNYNNLLKKELPNSNENYEIYLITSTRYDNFTITIYPLDIENFSYDNVFLTNNLGFINFTKLYPTFIDYEIKTGNLVLVCIMEYHALNSSINELNYFLYSFNEKNNGFFRNLQTSTKLPKITGLEKISSQLEIQYPLFNYYNESSLINKRNKDNLVENIKKMYELHPEIELYNISDPFYNDICFVFTSDVGTDMTLNDRRNEYYINYSLCEENCSIIKIINKDSNPRALCVCDIKNTLTFDSQKGTKDTLNPYYVQNIRSFVCGEESFNFYIAKNGIFWIFIIIIIFQIFILVRYLLYRKNVLNRMLGIYDKNQDNIEEIISSKENSLDMYKKNSLQKSEISLQNNQDNQNIQNVKRYENLKMKENEKSENEKYQENQKNKNNKNNENNQDIINDSNNQNNSQQLDNMSAPINTSNPPKKRNLKQPVTVSTKGDIKFEEKDLISRNESSYLKGSTFKNDKNQQDFTDISFDDLQNEDDQYYINNLLRKRKMLENNYLNNPLYLERMKKLKKIKKSLRPLNKNDMKKYYNTNEDILYPNQDQNQNRLKIKKNKKITKILGGEDIIGKNLIQNYSDCEKKPCYPHIKDNNNFMFEEEKGFLGDEKIIFSGGILKDGGNILIDENENSNNLNIQSILKESDNNNKSLKSNKKNKNTLSKSLGKKELNIIKEKENNNNGERIKTEIENDTKNKIKTELVNAGKGDKRPHSSVRKFSIKKTKNNNISNESDYNDLIKSNTIQPLKLKSKNQYQKQNSNNNDLSKENDSKRLMIKFQEEGELYGDNAQPNEVEDQQKQRYSRNLEILNEKNLVSSVSDLISADNKEKLIEDNFILFYWKYFIKRELGFVCIRDIKNTIPYFVRYSCLAFCVSFIFLLNCFLFLESAVHKRYLNALSGKRNRLGYYFKKEFGTTCCVALLGNLFKMIIIKLLLYKVFKIGRKPKQMMKSSTEKGLSQDELLQLQYKRQKYLKDYNRNLIIYFSCLMVLNIFIGYICICYGGVFPNSIGAFLYGLLFSLIMSFIFCAAICFLIVCIYKLGNYLNNKCVVSAYIVLSTLY